MSYSFMRMREIPDSEQHKEFTTVKAAVTEATEQGTFTAIAAAFGNVDRVGDRIVKGAFTETIRRWREAGRDVPLVWDHGRDARDVIGSIDSSTMQERDAGLFVEGQLDIEDSELAREAWRSVKRGRISLSFGYLTETEREGPDGVKELTRLDLMEVTLTSVPANPDARVLSAKSVTDSESDSPDFDSMTTDQLRVRSMAAIADVDVKRHRPITVATFEC